MPCQGPPQRREDRDACTRPPGAVCRGRREAEPVTLARRAGSPAAAMLARRTRATTPAVSGGIRVIDFPSSRAQFELDSCCRDLRRHLAAVA
jgi:hypothetical protein